MHCPACRAELPAQAQFCPQCGAAQTAAKAAGAPAPGRPATRVSRNDPEVELWRGSFSPKAMIPAWLFCGAVTLAGIVVAFTVPQPAAWLTIAGAVGVLWAYHVLLLVYRRLAISYRLTNQRFFHETGILRRLSNRVEVIDMDDISLSQGVIDRMLGTGTICISSSDATDPKLWLRGIDNAREVAAQLDDARRKERLRRGMYIESI